ncbi:hypothetical protein XHC_0457 [Xanthomonas hortorum pv. carotae str. M081]|nr:hypothetical protein XHC_0457 [Xanthomonas hortorum pv. carotae str. M081]
MRPSNQAVWMSCVRSLWLRDSLHSAQRGDVQNAVTIAGVTILPV